MNKKILAISGSLRSSSSNLFILQWIANIIPAGINYEIYTGLEKTPPFNPDLDHEKISESVIDFRNKIKAADGILFCTPEYAFGVPGALKNALDWTVSSGEFTDKPVALITASSLGDKAHESLQQTLSVIGAKFTKNETLLISFIKSKMNTQGVITDVVTLQLIKETITHFLFSIGIKTNELN